MNMIKALKRQVYRWDFFAPRHDIDPAMKAASKGVHRLVMIRSTLINEVTALAEPHTEHLRKDQYSPHVVSNKLHTFPTRNIFWAKQALLIAAERDAQEGTSLSRELAMRIITTMGSHFAELAANLRSIPKDTDPREIISLCNHLYRAGYRGSFVIPNLTEQLEVIDQSKNQGYRLGSEGMLAPIIKRHYEHHLDVLRFCIDRGIENFSGENYYEYRSVGVMREGML